MGAFGLCFLVLSISCNGHLLASELAVSQFAPTTGQQDAESDSVSAEVGDQDVPPSDAGATANPNPGQSTDSGEEGKAQLAPELPGDRILNERYRRAMIIDFDGPIFGAQHAYLNNRLDRAERQGVDLVIVRLTSPGGLLVESVQLARRLAEIDWATTIAYVPEEAISGGAILALGCDRIYMRPRALIGDAGPIVLGPDGIFEHAEEKTVSYLKVEMRVLAKAKNRPQGLASAMADRSLKVFQVKNKNDGKIEYLSKDEIAERSNPDDYEVGPSIPEAGENRFLTVSGSRALELKIVEGTFESEADMLAALTIENRIETRQTWVDRTVYLLNRPWLTGLLLFIALIALYIELAAPGISVAGLTSLACFGLFFWSHALGGTSGWLEVLVFVLGVLCIIVEIFLLPGFGVFGLSGVLLVLLALVMATQDFVLPNNPSQWAQLQTNTLIVLGSIAVVGVLLLVQLLVLDSLPGLKRFQLRTPANDVALSAAAPTVSTSVLISGSKIDLALPQVGEQGVAESVLRPSGKVLFDGRLVDVVTEGDYLDPGTPVEVIRREGNRIVVRKQ